MHHIYNWFMHKDLLERDGVVMQIFTVSFFGHRRLEYAAEIQKKLERVLADLMANKEMLVFLVGRNGDFDLMASSTIKQLQNRYGRGRSVHTTDI